MSVLRSPEAGMGVGAGGGGGGGVATLACSVLIRSE